MVGETPGAVLSTTVTATSFKLAHAMPELVGQPAGRPQATPIHRCPAPRRSIA